MSTEWFNDADLESLAAIYLPLTAALVARVLHGPRPRQFAACLLSLLWVTPALLAVETLATRAGWWSFAGYGTLSGSMPPPLFLGWALLWGLVPQMAFPRLAIGWVLAIMVVPDAIAMPFLSTVALGSRWLIGEAVAVAIVLLPALCIARWTLDDTHLRARACIQVVTSGMLFLYLLPEIVFTARPGAGWAPLIHEVSWRRQIGIQTLLLLAVPGVSAVMEFAERGRGTPIPYDPPQRLVTSGMYRYCANPMQLSCALVMLLWAVILRNGWLALAAAMSAIYGVGIARWDEGQDLERRFGAEWRNYRAVVKDWRVRWRPYTADPPARIYIAASCGPCNEVRAWLEAREPLGLQIVDAETLPSSSISRMRYDPGDGSAAVAGVRALGRALEHLNLWWAFAGAILRLPGIWQCVQLLMDASGLGPRTVISTACE